MKIRILCKLPEVLPSEDEAGDDREAASPLATPEALHHAGDAEQRGDEANAHQEWKYEAPGVTY